VESNATTCKSRDILSSRWRAFLLYWLPAIAIVVAGVPAVSSGWRTVVWQCTRPQRSAFTVALSYGLGMLHLGRNGWNLFGLITLIGAIALWCLPEMLLGKYRKRN